MRNGIGKSRGNSMRRSCICHVERFRHASIDNHSTFSVFRCKVRYSEYSNEETLSWTRIRRIESPPAQILLEPQPAAALPEEDLAADARNVSPESTEATDEVPLAFAGMRPRSLCVEREMPAKAPLGHGDDVTALDADVDVVNPVLFSSPPGRKMSWKEKLRAKKAATSDGTLVHEKKQVSLVPDFAAKRRKDQQDYVLDQSELRTKVVFGMGSSKKTYR